MLPLSCCQCHCHFSCRSVNVLNKPNIIIKAYKNNNIPLNDPQVYRQLTEIGRFTKDIRHVSGVDNVFADFLSRIRDDQRGEAYLEDSETNQDTVLDPEVASTETIQFQLTSLATIADLQNECPEVKLILSGDTPKNTTFKKEVIDGVEILCELSSSQARPFVPEPLRYQIMGSLHALDHVGIAASVSRIADLLARPQARRQEVCQAL